MWHSVKSELLFNFARLTECISLAQIYKDFDVKIYAKVFILTFKGYKRRRILSQNVILCNKPTYVPMFEP